MAISAWKSIPNAEWALRINPSSGNLHPTEAHLILSDLGASMSGVYHYSPFSHALEKRAVLPSTIFDKIDNHFKTKGFFIAVTSIHWREAWKYGERAFRYSNHDAGHAMAAIRFAANLFGWSCLYLNNLSDKAIETMLGLDKTGWPYLDKEEADFLCFVYPGKEINIPPYLPESVVDEFREIQFAGEPNKLSENHDNWEIIYEASEAIKKPYTPVQQYFYEKPENGPMFPDLNLRAAEIIRKRRSATDFDRKKSVISSQDFFALLEKTLPREGRSPFDMKLGYANIHLAIFVHNVTGLKSGLYIFVRNPEHMEILKKEYFGDFLWEKVNNSLPLYILAEGDFRNTAGNISCTQEIAGDGAFSLGMLARFDDILKNTPFLYKHLFWESGMIGQVLYLEAEARGLRGTGIGCFFDDEMHKILGIKTRAFQSLYHFTVGSPVEDTRLTTLSPYFHIRHSERTP